MFLRLFTMINTSDFAKRLQLVIDHYQLNASSFADRIGVQRSSISHILSERNKPSLDFVMKVLHEFPEVELYWLLNGKGMFPKMKNKEAPELPFLNKEENNTSKVKDEEAPKYGILSENVVKKQKTDIDRIVIFYEDGTFEVFKNK